MLKRMILMIVVLALVLGGVFGYKVFVKYKIDQVLSQRKPPPITVSTQTVDTATWTARIRTTGTLRAAQGIEVTSELGGIVEQIDFESGQRVEQGELLVALDTTVEQARLKGQQATLKLARQTLTRKQSLRERGLGSQADLDQAQAKYQQAQAAIAATRAIIDKKHIEAPFGGVIGIRKVDIGQYLPPGTSIATLQALDQMYLDFELPQATYNRVTVGQTVQLALDAYPERVFEGEVTAIDPLIDQATRSYRVRATLANPNGELRPGMFGQVTLRLEDSREVITVPRTAIAYNPYGDFVYVVTQASPGNGSAGGNQESASESPVLTVQRRNVHTGESRADQVQIVRGLEVGERIVIAGNHKLRPGARILIDNSRIPEVDSHPTNVDNY